MIRINLLPYRAARKKENIRQQVSIFVLLVGFVVIIMGWYNSHLNGKIDNLKSQIEITKKEIIRYQEIAKEVEALKQKLALLQRKVDVIRALEKNWETAFKILEAMTRMVVEKKMWLTSIQAMDEKRKEPKGGAKGDSKKKGKTEAAKESGKEGEKKPEDAKGEVKSEAKGGAAEAAKGGKSASKTEQKPPEPPLGIEITIQGMALDEKTVADFMIRLQESKLFSDVRLITLTQQKFRQSQGREDIFLKSFQVACKNYPLKKDAGLDQSGKSEDSKKNMKGKDEKGSKEEKG